MPFKLDSWGCPFKFNWALPEFKKNSSTLVNLPSTGHNGLGPFLASTNENIEHGALMGRQGPL